MSQKYKYWEKTEGAIELKTNENVKKSAGYQILNNHMLESTPLYSEIYTVQYGEYACYRYCRKYKKGMDNYSRQNLMHAS